MVLAAGHVEKKDNMILPFLIQTNGQECCGIFIFYNLSELEKSDAILNNKTIVTIIKYYPGKTKMGFLLYNTGKIDGFFMYVRSAYIGKQNL